MQESRNKSSMIKYHDRQIETKFFYKQEFTQFVSKKSGPTFSQKTFSQNKELR